MTEKPLVSFVLVAYKQERFIREALEGAFAQTYSPLEIIVSDDCSPDRTFEIIQEMTAAYQGPHKTVLNRNSKNLGLCGNFNRAMELSSGELIVVAAGDDVSSPIRVHRLYKAWLGSGCKPMSVLSNARIIDQFGVTIEEEYFRRANDSEGAKIDLISYDKKARLMIHTLENLSGCLGNWVLGAAHAFDRRIFDFFGPLPANLIQEDVALAWRTTILGSFAYVPEPLVNYRRHVENLYPDNPSPEREQTSAEKPNAGEFDE